jgi:hypothetical protein
VNACYALIILLHSLHFWVSHKCASVLTSTSHVCPSPFAPCAAFVSILNNLPLHEREYWPRHFFCFATIHLFRYRNPFQVDQILNIILLPQQSVTLQEVIKGMLLCAFFNQRTLYKSVCASIFYTNNGILIVCYFSCIKSKINNLTGIRVVWIKWVNIHKVFGTVSHIKQFLYEN